MKARQIAKEERDKDLKEWVEKRRAIKVKSRANVKQIVRILLFEFLIEFAMFGLSSVLN